MTLLQKTIWFPLLSSFLIAAIFLVGCEDQGDASEASNQEASAETETYDVGIIRWDPADIYFNGVQLGQELERQRIEEEENVEINFKVFGANDASEQRSALDAQVAQGVDGVALVPWRGKAMRESIKKLRSRQIPTVVSNAWVPDAQQVFVSFGNEQAGRLAGEAIVDRLEALRGDNWAQEGGVIIELRCIITASFDISRHNGYRSVFDPIAEQHENLSIVTEEAGCDGGKARNAVDDIISRYGSDQVLAVASIDGTMAVGGAVSALDTRDMLHPKDDSRHIPISTIDGTVPELRALSEGKIDHVSVQPAVGEGIMTMRLLYRMMKSGESFIAEEDAESMSGDELWMPVQVASSDGFEGPWFKTSVYTIPGDVSPSNPKIWSNRLHKRENGSLPDYASEATASAN